MTEKEADALNEFIIGCQHTTELNVLKSRWSMGRSNEIRIVGNVTVTEKGGNSYGI